MPSLQHRLERFAQRASTLARAFLKQCANSLTLAGRYGQFRTMREWSCVDAYGRPIPWYTYPAIEYLSHIDFSGMRVLEYGSGNSSLWWLGRCREVTSIENDPVWHARISLQAAGKPGLHYRLERTEQAYVQQSGLREAQVVVIDGVHRSRCADAFVLACRDGPSAAMMLIFDNSDWYPKTIQKLRDSLDWLQVDFHGFGPINRYTSTTSIFINPHLAGKLAYTRPLASLAWIDNASANPDDMPAP
ncbi:MAG: SAM-dependent methyltransferase [Betaproteobacteria bacterium]|jgi:hypothetical protein|nr:SAM-dependent methyltransferase [Betaproteobacteria bacterium]